MLTARALTDNTSYGNFGDQSLHQFLQRKYDHEDISGCLTTGIEIMDVLSVEINELQDVKAEAPTPDPVPEPLPEPPKRVRNPRDYII